MIKLSTAVLFVTASFILPSNAYLDFSIANSYSRSIQRRSLTCSRISAVAVAKKEGKQKFAVEDDGPEGGWAPPAWKRKIMNPLKDLQYGQGPIKGIVRNVEVHIDFLLVCVV